MKKVIATTLRVMVIAVLGILPMSATANVIYDVQVNYSGGYTYSFSIEFLGNVGIKGNGHVWSSGGFQNEQFSDGITTWAALVDNNDLVVVFDPFVNAMLFHSVDSFQHPQCVPCLTYTFTDDYVLLTGATHPLVGFATESMDIVLRTNQIPEPASAVLLAAAFPALWATRRRRNA